MDYGSQKNISFYQIHDEITIETKYGEEQKVNNIMKMNANQPVLHRSKMTAVETGWCFCCGFYIMHFLICMFNAEREMC